MYSAVLLAALSTTAPAPSWHHSYGPVCTYGPPYLYNPGCYGCYGYGFAGGGYGYHGGCYGAYGGGYDSNYYYFGGCTGCYGCYGGHSCYGYPVPIATNGTPRASTTIPPRDAFPPAPEPAPKPAPGVDGAEEVGSPKEKKKDSEAKPGEQKKLSQQSTEPTRARVRIEIPQGATLYVDDHRIDTPAGMRTFQTPPLEPGERYYYDIRIERGDLVYRQRVIVASGQEVAVRMSKPATATAQR